MMMIMYEVTYNVTAVREQLFMLSYLTGRTFMRCWAQAVSDS